MALLNARLARFNMLLAAAGVAAFARAALPAPNGEADQEHVVKAAFIYNFAKYVEWPPGAFTNGEAPFVIGIVGTDPFGAALDRAVQGKSVAGRPFAVRRLRWDGDLRSCQILIVAGSEKGRARQIATTLRGAPVLTVGDCPGLASHGTVLSFFLDEGSVRFEINQESAKRAKLAVSSKLLTLAKLVSDAK